MNVTCKQIHIHESNPNTLSSGKPLASVARADWANVVDPSASFKSYNREASLNFPKFPD